MKNFLAWIAGLFWPREKKQGVLVYAKTFEEIQLCVKDIGAFATGFRVMDWTAMANGPFLWLIEIKYEKIQDGIDIHGLGPYAKTNNPKPNRPPQCEPWNR